MGPRIELDDENKEIVRTLFKPAGIQRFRSEAELRDYLRLVAALQRPQPRPWGTGKLLALSLGAAALGAVVGYFWRKHRQHAHHDRDGLHLLGAA